MEFLKQILGEELYNRVATAINAYNGDEANKDNQIKLANLGEGKFVSKDKYAALEASLGGKSSELDAANELIKELKKANKNEDVQNKFKEYDEEVAKLQKELAETKLKSAIKVALINDHALDVDYLTYKINQSDKELSLDENGNIKDWKDIVEGLKTQYPTQFETKKDVNINPKPLPFKESGSNNVPSTLAEALKQNYMNEGE